VDHAFSGISADSLVWIVPLLGLALLAGFLAGRSGRKEILNEQGKLRERLVRVETDSNEQYRRAVAKMRRQQDTVSNLALALPSVVRDLNRDDLDPTDIPRLILQLANAIFEPRQILLYGFRAAGADGRERMLTLSAHQGLDPVPDALRTVRVGEGKIGWAAAHELDMLKDDWDTLRANDRLEVPNNHSLLAADMIGPLVHHAKQRKHVLGVLCIGEPRIRPREEKLMFQMVTNFGSLGLITSLNIKKLRSAAHHDGLTGLLNKRCFLEDVATKALVECEGKAKPFSIFIFDIDHFKIFNDTNGHPAGDQLLRGMGGLIRRHLRPGDLACRYGGEEFVIATPGTDGPAAFELAERLRRAIEAEPFEHRESQPMGGVTISGGVATFPHDGTSVAELLQRADEALYRSKKGGRNRVNSHKGIDIGDAGDSPPVIEDPGDAASVDLTARC